MDKESFSAAVDMIRRHESRIEVRKKTMAMDFEKLANVAMDGGDYIPIPSTRVTDADMKQAMLASKIKKVGGKIMVCGNGTTRTHRPVELSVKSISDLTTAICRSGQRGAGLKQYWVTFRDRKKVTFHAPRQFMVKCRDGKQALAIADCVQTMNKFSFVCISTNRPNRPQAIELDGDNWDAEFEAKVLNQKPNAEDVLN